MTAFLVPTTPIPQTFSIQLAGVAYNLTIRWNDVLYRGGLATPSWLLDIADATGNALVGGIPLITGADLLAQYAYLGIDGQLVVQSTNDADLVPDFETLGSTGNLYFVTSD